MLPDSLVESVLPISEAIAVDVHSMIRFEKVGVTVDDAAGSSCCKLLIYNFPTVISEKEVRTYL